LTTHTHFLLNAKDFTTQKICVTTGLLGFWGNKQNFD